MTIVEYFDGVGVRLCFFDIVALSATFIYAQSSRLTMQPFTSRVGVNNTNPSYTLDVTGRVNATAKKWGAELFGTNGKK